MLQYVETIFYAKLDFSCASDDPLQIIYSYSCYMYFTIHIIHTACWG
jgi:hypothetical protein